MRLNVSLSGSNSAHSSLCLDIYVSFYCAWLNRGVFLNSEREHSCTVRKEKYKHKFQFFQKRKLISYLLTSFSRDGNKNIYTNLQNASSIVMLCSEDCSLMFPFQSLTTLKYPPLSDDCPPDTPFIQEAPFTKLKLLMVNFGKQLPGF